MFKSYPYVSQFKAYLLAFIFLFGFSASLSANEEQVKELLTLKAAPVGVVFEVVSWDEAYLKTALDNFEKYQAQLKAKFPEIGLAVVTHGNEQFSLTEDNSKKYQATHKQVQRITETKVPVHICAGHARMRAIDTSTFPDYVSVSRSGPAEIRNYQALGYTLIIL